MSVLTIGQTVDIGYGRGRLAPDASASIARIDAQIGRPLDINSAWRDPELQDRMYEAWSAYIDGRGPKPNHGRALPSWSSVHCKGFAIDTDDTALARILNDHGWFRTASDEPWHYEYFEHRDYHRNEPAGGDAVPFPDTGSEYEIMFIANVRNGSFWLCEPGKKAHLLGKGSGARESGIPIINYPDDWAVSQLQKSRPEIS